MVPTRRFDREYREDITLRDGTRVRLRLVRPEDKPLLLDGFARLSDRSRYQRFFTGKERLSRAELRYLTEIDGEDHFAIGAVEILPDGAEVGLGIARFVRLPDRPGVAEPAVAVVDAAQGRGLGKLLCERLVLAASERGVRTFRSEVLASNDSVRALIRNALPDAVEHPDGGGEIVVEIPVPELPADALGANLPRESAIARLLVLAAQGLLVVRRALVALLHASAMAPTDEQPGSG